MTRARRKKCRALSFADPSADRVRDPRSIVPAVSTSTRGRRRAAISSGRSGKIIYVHPGRLRLKWAMCEFCTKHGEGKVWYKNAANYGQDLLSDLGRRRYIEGFLTSAFSEGFETLGRLETIFRQKGRLPPAVKAAMINKAKTEHFGQ